MTHSRRTWLKDSLSLAGLAGLASAQPLPQLQQMSSDERNILQFWTRGVRQFSQSPDRGNRQGGVTLRNLLKPGAGREPEFLLFDEDEGLRLARKLDERGMPAQGDVAVEWMLRNYRMSREDQERFTDDNAGTLRVDVGQQSPFPNLGEILSWTVVAALAPAPKARAAASEALARYEKSVRAEWGKVQSVALPGGGGWCTMNLFLKRRSTIWGTLLSAFLRTSRQFAPVLSLPAIAMPALTALDNFIGQLHVQGGADGQSWVLQSSQAQFCCTYDSMKRSSEDAVRIRTGTYLVVPMTHVDQLDGAEKDFRIDRGYLVPKGTRDLQVRRAAEETLPDLTYFTVQARVRPRAMCECPPA